MDYGDGGGGVMSLRNSVTLPNTRTLDEKIANQIPVKSASANWRQSSKHQFENASIKISLFLTLLKPK